MSRALLAVVIACSSILVQAAKPIWLETFDDGGTNLPADLLVKVEGRGAVLHISVPAGTANPGRTITLPVPVVKVRGRQVFLGADVRTADISQKPKSWNGAKLMLILESPSGRIYPQAEVPVGTIDWQRLATPIAVPENVTNAFVVLGLEQVTGEVWFDNLSITPKARFRSTLKVNPSSPIFRGHSFPRLRGAMAGTSLNEEDVRHFASVWKGNLLRLQIFESASKDRALEAYDSWLNGRLEYIDRVLGWCEKYRVMAVVDLHSPPGGQAFSAGYITARGQIFTRPAAQAKFIAVWETMARRYKGRQIIWGFDVVNEPDDSNLGEDCLDWNTLADKTARGIRAIDPDRTLIIEPNQWGGPQGFAAFEPLDLSNIVYSFHFYQPMKFTHQGIHNQPGGVTYPGVIGGEEWDQNALERAMLPAIEFAKKWRVHMYVGEFSAIRTAPGNSAAKYLADLIDILERHGFDWSYHAYREWQGWSLEHEGPLDQPMASPTNPRQQVVTGWFARNAPGAKAGQP